MISGRLASSDSSFSRTHQIVMHVVLFGGTGRTGYATAEALLERDALVTLFLRESSEVPESLKGRVQEFRGSATDAESVGAVLADANAAVVCVGNDALLQRETIRTDVTRAVCEAARDTAVRVIVLSALGARGSGEQLPLYIRHFALFLLQQPLHDHDEQEAVVEEILPPERFMVLRPVMLTNGPQRGSYFASDTGVTPSMFISRKDVGHFIGAQLCPPVEYGGETHKSYFGKFVALSSN